MGDFDFGFSEGPREPDYDRQSHATENRYEHAQRRQGFSQPFDRSPIRNPSGWYGGAVRQTGGMIMVREWSTLPNGQLYTTAQDRPGRKYEYEVAYGSEPGVSIHKYKWHDNEFRDGSGGYTFDGEVESVSVRSNTDQAKARAAKRLMEKHGGKTR